MTVRRAIEVKAFGGKRMFKRSGNSRFIRLTSGTGTADKVGVLSYDSSGGDVYLAIDTAGTGTQINA
jgi:hypothetical protein